MENSLAAGITFSCDLALAGKKLNHVWEHTIGSGHATLALRADWQAQMRRCHDELGFRYVRFHGILCDDMGTFLINCDEPLYSFFNADQIFDFLLSIGMKPFVELSFMPTGLSSGDKTVFHYRANVTPPKDYSKWAELIQKLVSHWSERYGADEVSQWFFEVWNEPNLDAFGTGKIEDYFKLYQSTVDAIKTVNKSFKVGGPATAMNAWIIEFVDFCEKNHLAADFVSTHHYPTDAFGKPGDDTETQLSLSKRSVLRGQALTAKEQAKNRPVYYTEWSSSSNPRDHLHDEPYAAAFAVKTILECDDIVKAYSYWTFSDIFEENYFPSVPFHGGFGLLNIHGIAKPVYRAYELLHNLGNILLPVEGSHQTIDIWVTRNNEKIDLIITNFALPRHEIKTENVHLSLKNPSKPIGCCLQKIDQDNCNPKKLWSEMGEPTYLNKEVLASLQQASLLKKTPLEFTFTDDVVRLSVNVPPLSVYAITIDLV